MNLQPESIRTRAASPSDAARLAAAAERMFRESFAETNDPAQMDLYCQSHFSEAIQAAELAAPGAQVLFVEEGDDVIAFAHLQLDTPAAQLQRFYVRREWHGKGLAQFLMRQCLQMAREHGSKRIWLAVWKENPRAIAFYRKFGFEVTAEQPFVLGTEVQSDYVMERAL